MLERAGIQHVSVCASKKSASPSYVNDFFLLTTFPFNDRFEDIVVLLTSVSYEQIDAARDDLEVGYRSGSPDTGLPFELSWAGLMLNIFGLE
jgi:hypothetical protein